MITWVQMSRLYDWYGWMLGATVATYLTEKEKKGGHRQKLYANHHRRIFKLIKKHLIANLRVVVEYHAEDEFLSRPDGNGHQC